MTSIKFEAGDEIIMYGVTVGAATQTILPGQLLTTENVAHKSSTYTGKNLEFTWEEPDLGDLKNKTFDGYHRSNGKVGTANHWVFIPLVFCESRNLEMLKSALRKTLGYSFDDPYTTFAQELRSSFENGADKEKLNKISSGSDKLSQKPLFANVDGLKFLDHGLGCGGTRDDAKTLCGLIAGYITHPNVAGATILSLGCQNAQVSILEEEIENRDPNFKKPRFFLNTIG